MTQVQPRCPVCGLSPTLCLCAVLPRLELRTRLVLVIHHYELRRSSNTGLLAQRALVNSVVRVRGAGRERLDLTDLLSPDHRSLLFFPSADALELTRELVGRDSRPIQLIVPDGNWRQAGKLHTRQAELRAIPRVKIAAPTETRYQLRAQVRPGRMATLQAVAAALRVIEGDAVGDQLLRLYDARVARTLSARGLPLDTLR